MKKLMKNRKGFTLIELIVVIAILGILAAVLIPRFTGFQDKARATKALVDAKQIATAMDSLQSETNSTTVWTTVQQDIFDVAFGKGKTNGGEAGTLVVQSNGGFTWTITSTGAVAGRADGNSKVEMNPTLVAP